MAARRRLARAIIIPVASPGQTLMQERRPHRWIRNDLELLAVVLIWGFNMVVVKVGLREFEPLAYNVVRFIGASTVLLLLTRQREGSLKVSREDLGRLILLGVIGHLAYQIFFIEGIARTTATSTALIFGSTPVVVALMSWMAGHERIGWTGAAGAGLGFGGIYLIVGSDTDLIGTSVTAGADPDGSADATLLGNLLVVGAVLCWSSYSVLARPMLERYSPLRVTAITLSIGTLLLVPPAIPDLISQDWGSISTLNWSGLVFSLIFALVFCYVVWYRSVKKVGNIRTAVYTNLVPVFGTLFGVWLLHERLTAGLWLGAACILTGIVLTRLRV